MATKILKDGLSNKQRILRMVERWDDDIPFEQALYHMHVMKEVMESIQEVENGAECVDHDELFDELERLCDEEEAQAKLDAKSRKKSKGNSPADRNVRNAKNGQGIRKPNKKARQPAS